MKIKLKVSFFVFCISSFIYSQTLSGDYQGYLYQKYYIGKYEKGKFILIDSIKLDSKGFYSKNLDSKLYTPNTLYVVASEGEYKEKKNIESPHPHGSIRFVYLGDDISYQTSWRQETGYLNFKKGGEPSNHLKELSIQLGKVQNIITSFDQLWRQLEADDDFYNHLINSYINKVTAFNNYCKNIASNYPKGSYMYVYALMFQQVMPQKGMKFIDFETYRAKNLFQYTDLKNPLIANIPLLPVMFRSYLHHNQPNGMVMSNEIQKMQEEAKLFIQDNAAAEVLEALNMHDFRPQAQILREKLIKELNFDLLYSDNKAWFTQINEVLGAYDNTAPYHDLFGKDIFLALERTHNPIAYTKLAESAFSITEQFNWSSAQTEIVSYLTEKADDRLLKGSGKVAQIYTMKNLQIGKVAPDLIIDINTNNFNPTSSKKVILQSKEFAHKGYDKTLLVFYKSGCGPCEIFMKILPGMHNQLMKKGFKIISIAADENNNNFEALSKLYPWNEKYCDGSDGVNFKNYAVIGTPTIYVIDKLGKIEAKLASIEEIEQLINK